MSEQLTEKQVRKLLEKPFWLPTLNTQSTYTRIHDDHDGTKEGRISVTFGQDGDAWVMIDKAYQFLRFRNEFGGGMSLRTHNALMILAEAIRMDNEERPQR